jgi:hypothetical protein
MINNRLEILVLDRRNGIISNEYQDVQSLLAFLNRSGNIHRFQVMARIGKKAVYFDRLDDLNQLVKDVAEFQNQQRQPQ